MPIQVTSHSSKGRMCSLQSPTSWRKGNPHLGFSGMPNWTRNPHLGFLALPNWTRPTTLLCEISLPPSPLDRHPHARNCPASTSCRTTNPNRDPNPFIGKTNKEGKTNWTRTMTLLCEIPLSSFSSGSSSHARNCPVSASCPITNPNRNPNPFIGKTKKEARVKRNGEGLELFKHVSFSRF